MPFTLVSFHAHPDDEALMTGGTLARAAAEGHRVVLVTATAGEAGLSDGRPDHLRERRLAELRRAAHALGCARVEVLGYPDSGWDTPVASPEEGDGGAATPFSRLDVEGPARRLAALLEEERADVVTVYDPWGGYGHPDHRQVHRVGSRAAELAGTRVVLEATLDRTLLQRWARRLRGLPGLGRLVDRAVPDWGFVEGYLPREQLTHRVDVRRHLAAKRAALAAHHSQTTGGSGPRTVGLLLALPPALLRPVLGHEWFREQGRARDAATSTLLDDVFATLR